MKQADEFSVLSVLVSCFLVFFSIGAFMVYNSAMAQQSSGANQSNQPDSVVISGMVTHNGAPIAGAVVQIQGETEFTKTDDQGYFILKEANYPDNQVPVTAGQKDYYNNGLYSHRRASDIEILLNEIEIGDNPDYEFIPPQPNYMQAKMNQTLQMMGGAMNGATDPDSRMGMGMGMMGRGRGMMMGGSSAAMACGNCHDNFYNEWKNSTMATASNNQWVLDYYNGTGSDGARNISPGFRLDYPNSSGNCANCHAPEMSIDHAGQVDLNNAFATSNEALRGVTCDFCHKMRQVTISNLPGVEKIELNRIQPYGTMMMMPPVFAFGPYVDVVTTPMAASYSPLQETAKYCSGCHQSAWPLHEGGSWDYTAVYKDGDKYVLYADGKVIPNYWTYQEWLEWQDGLAPDDPDKGRKCQDCHMNWTREMLPYDKYIVSGAARAQLGIERDPSRINPHEFQGVTESRLKGAVYLSLDANYEGDELVADVEVVNVNTGHWLPTGSAMRNMILVITATGADGNQLIQTVGPRVPDWGGIGNAADANYGGMPGKGYAKVTRDANGNLNVPVWQAVAIESDNRIKQKQADDVSVRFKRPAYGGSVNVKAQLIYRKTFKAIAERKGWQLQDMIMRESSLTL